MKVVVLGGGTSPERDVSLRSAKAVAEAARNAGFEVDEYDPADGLEFLDTLPKDVIVLPILHGAGGEDGVVQSELEKRGLAYLGSDSRVSAVCFDKAKTRSALQAAGLPVAKGDSVTSKTYWDHPLAQAPHVLKASHGGSSIGTLIVRDVATRTAEQVEEIFALDEHAVIEELVEGIEITVPVLGSAVLPIVEVKLPPNAEFDYENKYNGATEELCPPVSFDEEQQKSLQELGVKAHQALGCRHLSRTDVIVRSDGSAVILETNTIPGMTDQSFFPKAARVGGFEFPALVEEFVRLVQSEK